MFFIVLPDQRSGSAFCAIRYSSSRCFSRALSSPRCCCLGVSYRISLSRYSSLYQRVNFSIHSRASSSVVNPVRMATAVHTSGCGTGIQDAHCHYSLATTVRRPDIQLLQFHLKGLRFHRRTIIRVQHQGLT